MRQIRNHHRYAGLSPRAAAPLSARSVGNTFLDPGEIQRREPGAFHQFFWAVSGDGRFAWPDGSDTRLRAGEVLAYGPRTPHRIEAGERGMEYRFWTVDGPLARQAVEAFGLTPPWPKFAGPAPVELFDRLYELLLDVRLEAERQANGVAYQLLIAASSPARGADELAQSPDPAVRLCLRHLLDGFADPTLGIEDVAWSLKIDRSVLSRRFRKAVGLSPKQYLSSLRMSRALKLLKETERPIGEVARLTGFASLVYFSRAVRKATGLSPSEYRRS